MKKTTTLFLLLVIGNMVLAQSNCQNLDFEDGDYNGWIQEYARNAALLSGSSTHSIDQIDTSTLANTDSSFALNDIGQDPFLLNYGHQLPLNNPYSGTTALRMGLGKGINNPSAQRGAERISYNFSLLSGQQIVSFAYAFVQQDPSGHQNHEMPYFAVELLDSSGNQIPNSYYFVTVQSLSNLFTQVAPGTYYKNWAKVSFSVDTLAGQNLTLRFTNADCALGGHWGYSYVDFICDQPSLQLVQNSGSLNLEAPEGYMSYLWNTGATTSSIPITNSGTYTVDITSENGFTFQLDTTISIATDINEVRGEDVSLYPNPASDILNLKSNETIKSFSISDVTGRFVLVDQINAKSGMIDVKFLNPGVYHISVTSEGLKTQTFKFLKR
ncbi:MAG: T9SS type A sorting domain-containing protein [Flavobacteriales bacterium]|nr:T9SS type A sorting domain-containing protein [Flavobacteriales bacterium]